MIITGGSYKGKKLKPLKGDTVRSSTSLLRESLFNILQEKVHKCIFVDLFAGSGIVGLEALSRGAEKATFVEKNKHNVKLIKSNIDLLGVREQTRIIATPVEEVIRCLAPEQADIIFLDPPYNMIEPEYMQQIFTSIIENNALARDGLIILEHSTDCDAQRFTIHSLQLVKQKKYGKSSLAFWEKVNNLD